MRTISSPMRMELRMLIAAVGALLLVGVASCSGPQETTSPQVSDTPSAVNSSSPAPSPSSTPASPSGAVTPSRSPLPKGVSTAKPKDPVTTGAVQQVSRDGKKPHPTIRTTSGKQSFAKPITYTDGLQLKVNKITQGTMSGHGPGVYPGRAVTTFRLALTNDTQSKLDLGVVVVTVTYGSPARVAHHIYDDQSVDFSGVVVPGETTKAVYGFSIPASARGDVTMTVDIDGRHHLAVFHGDVK